MTTGSTVEGPELPPDVAELFRQAGRMDDPPETLGAGFEAVTDLLDEAGVTVTLEDMYQPESTRHAVHVGDTVEHVPCVLDAFIVAILHDDVVEIRSESPARGEVIRFHVADDEITASPERAVVSFGLGRDEATDPDPDSIRKTLNDPDAPLPTTCLVTNAFPDTAAYEAWAAGVTDAAVMQLDVETMFALAKRIAQSSVSE